MASDIQQDRAFAQECLTRGNFAAAEVVCRNLLDSDPADVATLNMLGTVADTVGMRDHAARIFSSVLTLAPEDRTARGMLKALQAEPPLPPPSAPRYLVIKSWGCGFCSDVTQVLGGLLLAEATGRIPVVHWGRNSLFGDGSAANAFHHYFEPVSNITLDDIARLRDAAFFPPKWSPQNLTAEDVSKWQGNYSRAAPLYFLAQPETVAVFDFYAGVIDVAPWLPPDHPMHGKPLAEVYLYLVDKYLRPRQHILANCEAFRRQHLAGGPFVALHIRGADKGGEDPDLEETNRSNFAALQGLGSEWKIFLLTDDENWLRRVRDAYGERVVTTDCRRTAGTTGLHYLNLGDRVRLGLEVMTDVYVARAADKFIGSGSSNVAALIAVLKDWNAGDCVLGAPSQLMARNLFIYLAQP